ncbi:O-methyltransferase-domain-containing protein [Coniochaeta sp. 2T2.1]|nr:O-methyltransferase-domain-containing protein [Coniochaeta sp. 2T2.1]
MGSLAAPQGTLSELAEKVFASTKQLEAFLDAERLPQPSFAADGPTYVVPKTAHKATQNARVAVAEAALKLFNLVSGPSELLPNITANYHTMFCLQWLLHFNVLSHVPLNGTTTYGALAAAAKVPESQLKSVARMAMTSAILVEPETGVVAHTANSAMFLKAPAMRDWAGYMFEASIPTAAAMVEATERWAGSAQKTETAYNIAFKHDLPFFDHLSQNEQLTAQFSRYMKSVTDGQAMDLSHLVNGFDWKSLADGSLVVDIGGSTGHGSLALGAAYPGLKFEVQDLDVVASKQVTTAPQVSFKSHDFFKPQPTIGASVYLLRMIIHDWPDAEAQTILRNIVPALTPEESTLLIMDTVLPLSGRLPSIRERVIRTRDLTMRQVFNAQERGLEDWEALLKSVDPRLELRHVEQPDGSNMSLLTVKLKAGS